MDSALGIFAQLLGSCFSAAMGPGLEDTHCFTAVYDGAHVRDVHVVTKDGAPVYQGETLYSEGPTGLQFVYVNSDGGAGTGKASVEGETLSYEMTMRAAPGKPDLPFKGQWRVRDNGYDAIADGQQPIRFLPAQ